MLQHSVPWGGVPTPNWRHSFPFSLWRSWTTRRPRLDWIKEVLADREEARRALPPAMSPGIVSLPATASADVQPRRMLEPTRAGGRRSLPVVAADAAHGGAKFLIPRLLPFPGKECRPQPRPARGGRGFAATRSQIVVTGSRPPQRLRRSRDALQFRSMRKVGRSPSGRGGGHSQGTASCSVAPARHADACRHQALR